MADMNSFTSAISVPKPTKITLKGSLKPQTYKDEENRKETAQWEGVKTRQPPGMPCAEFTFTTKMQEFPASHRSFSRGRGGSKAGKQ